MSVNQLQKKLNDEKPLSICSPTQAFGPKIGCENIPGATVFNMELLHELPTDWRVESSSNSVADTNRASAGRKKSNIYDKNSTTMNNFIDGPNIEDKDKPTSSNSSSRMDSKRNSDSYSYSEARRVSKQNKEVSL